MVTATWHASKNKVHELHRRYILNTLRTVNTRIIKKQILKNKFDIKDHDRHDDDLLINVIQPMMRVSRINVLKLTTCIMSVCSTLLSMQDVIKPLTM